MTSFIRTERAGDGAVNLIRFNRPDKKNAITQDMYESLTGALATGEADPAVRVHVILGTPGCFSAGNDLNDFITMAMSGGGGLARPVHGFLHQLARLEKPLVTGVDGIAVGIGTTLNLHADLTFATPRTRFHTPFVDLALLPEAGSSLIAPAVMGTQKAFALLAAGIPFSAEDAERAGLVYKVVGEEELEQAVLAAAGSLAAKPPEALRIARDLIRRTTRQAIIDRIDEEAALFGQRLKSAEALAAFQAFMTRKK